MAMATTIGSLALKIQASTAGLEKDLSKGLNLVNFFVKSANSTLRSTLTGVGGMANKLAAGSDPFDMLKESAKSLVGSIPKVGGFLAFAGTMAEGFYGKLMSVAGEMIETRKQAQMLGTDTQTMSELLFVAGGDAEVLFHGLEKLQHKLGDAATGGKEASGMFQRLGLDAQELADMPLTLKLETVADQFNRILAPVEKAHFLFQLFGKSGAEMAPLLSKGSTGIEAMIGKAHELGQVFDEGTAKQALDAAKAMKEFDQSVKGAWTQLAVGALPWLRAFQEEIKAAGGPLKALGLNATDFGDAKVQDAAFGMSAWDKLVAGVYAFQGAFKMAVLQVVTEARIGLDLLERVTPGKAGRKMKEAADSLRERSRPYKRVLSSRSTRPAKSGIRATSMARSRKWMRSASASRPGHSTPPLKTIPTRSS
jgi:hypothetical protein